MRFAKLLLVLAAFCLAALFKINGFWQSPGFVKNERSLFWTESAMHYYMAGEVAEGRSLSGYDARAQSPEGILLAQDIAPAMPWIVGKLYRIFDAGKPLDLFIGLIFPLYSSVTVIAIFLWGSAIFASAPAGLIGATLYAVSAPAFIRSSGAFIKEDLALPALMLGFYFFFFMRGYWYRAVIAGLLVSLGLLSWHFSQFMLLCFSAVYAAGLIIVRQRADRNVAIFTLILAITALVFPMLRATAFAASPAMAILFAILAFSFVPNRLRWAASVIALIVPLAFYLFSGLAEQSHVFGLVIDKIRFGFVKPEDPSLLSYETRSNWIEDFNSPSLYFLSYAVSLYLPLGIAALCWFARRTWRKPALGSLFILGMALTFLFFFSISRRMITIDIIFLTIAAGGAIASITGRPGRFARTIGALIIIFTLTYEGWKSWHYFGPNPVSEYLARQFPAGDNPDVFTVSEHQDTINWINKNVHEDRSILASMGFGPVILAYTGRPIIIHSMFDAKVMRDKVQRYVESLYGSEEDFYAFVRANKASYFLYEAKNMVFQGINSDSYIAGKSQPESGSAVFKFHFRPQELQHFRLVYQNNAYRVYQVAPPTTIAARYLEQPIYKQDIARAVREMHEARDLTVRGFLAGGAGDMAAAIKNWEEVKRRAPYTIDIHAHLCLAYVLIENYDLAKDNCRIQLDLQPHSPTGHFHAALLAERLGDKPTAILELQNTLSIDPRYIKAAQRLTTLNRR